MTDTWRYRLGILLVTGSAVAWSTAGYFTRLIPLDFWTMLLWRSVFAALGVFIYMLLYQPGRSLVAFRQLGLPGWGFALVSTISMVFYIASLRLTSVAHVSIIYGTVPLVAAALGWMMLRERPSTSALLASSVALAGVVVMVGMGREGSPAGDLLAFCMTLGLAALMVIGRRHPGLPVLAAACLSALLSALVALPFAQPAIPDATTLLQLALFGSVNLGLGMALFAIGSKMLPVTETALISALDAPLAPIWVLLAFGEVPRAATVVGGGLVFAAILAHILWGTLRKQRIDALAPVTSRQRLEPGLKIIAPGPIPPAQQP